MERPGYRRQAVCGRAEAGVEPRLCAQPVCQLLCGALLDAFAGSSWLVLLPCGLLHCAAGLASAKLFAGMERDQPPKPQGT